MTVREIELKNGTVYEVPESIFQMILSELPYELRMKQSPEGKVYCPEFETKILEACLKFGKKVKP